MGFWESLSLVLAHKVAIVTGGGTGIGKAVAASLARIGARVAIASRNPGHIEAAKADFETLGLPVLGLPMDLRKKNEIQQTELVCYLASDLAKGVTGQAINICGGQTMV